MWATLSSNGLVVYFYLELFLTCPYLGYTHGYPTLVQYCNHDHHPTRLWPPLVVAMELLGSLSTHDDHGNKNIFDNDQALPVCLSVLHISQWFSSYLRREMTCFAVLQFCSDMDDVKAWQ